MFGKTRTFIISQPFFPVPAVRDGAISLIIQDTIESLKSPDIKVISIWDEKMDLLHFDKIKCYFVSRKSLLLRVAKRILTHQVNSRLTYRITYTRYLDMLFGLIWYSIIDKPKALVVHTTRCEWVINIKKIFSKRNIKVIWYHHMSEDQNSDDDHLSRYSDIDAHIFVSCYSKEKFVEKLLPYDKLIVGKSYVIKNGINTEYFKQNHLFRKATREHYKISEDTIVILYIGKLIPRKGFHKFLDAYGLLSENAKKRTEVLVVGGTDYYRDEETSYVAEARQRAANIGAGVKFVGYVPHETITNYYSAADLLVFPSIDEEGMPLTVIEAQAMRLPVICSNVGGIPEVIINNETGLIYEHDGDPAILAQHLERLIEDYPLRMQFAQRAEENTKNNFDRKRMAEEFEAVIKSVLYDI